MNLRIETPSKFSVFIEDLAFIFNSYRSFFTVPVLWHMLQIHICSWCNLLLAIIVFTYYFAYPVSVRCGFMLIWSTWTEKWALSKINTFNRKLIERRIGKGGTANCITQCKLINNDIKGLHFWCNKKGIWKRMSPFAQNINPNKSFEKKLE